MTNLIIEDFTIPAIKVICNLAISFNVNFNKKYTHGSNYRYILQIIGRDNNCTNTVLLRSNNLRLLTKLGRCINTYLTSEKLGIILGGGNIETLNELKQFISDILDNLEIKNKTDWRY